MPGQFLKHLAGEMQARGGAGHGAGLPGEHGLVIVPVGLSRRGAECKAAAALPPAPAPWPRPLPRPQSAPPLPPARGGRRFPPGGRGRNGGFGPAAAGPGGWPGPARPPRPLPAGCGRWCKSSSTRPPLSLTPCSRAGKTRVSLTTSKSSGSNQSARSRNWAWTISPVARRAPKTRGVPPGQGLLGHQFRRQVVIEIFDQGLFLDIETRM